MGQLNLYVSKELEEKIKKEAKREGKSVSAFVLEIVQEKVAPKGWSKEFLKMLATPGFEDMPDDLEELPMQKRPGLDDL